MPAFVCRRCGSCCRWSGCVKLLPGEGERIAAYLGMSESEFFAGMTRLSPDRQCLSLTENADGSCVFLESAEGVAACRIDQVKPEQCRAFPEKWNFPGWEKLCEGAPEEFFEHG